MISKKDRSVRKKRVITELISVLFILELVFLSVFTVSRIKRRIYPLYFAEYADEYADIYGVPRALVYSTIKVESNFDTRAVSSAGAVGLMQLMPKTYEEMCRADGENVDFSLMYDPKTNIKYGVKYLSLMYERFGRWDYAMLAYNAGPDNVSSWIYPENLDENGDILDIPFGETKNYLIKINKAVKNYCKIYRMEEL